MKPYMVEITTYAVVMAEDAADAHEVARNLRRDIWRDDDYPQIDVQGEIETASRLGNGWNEHCIPYGGDGNTKLKELLETH